MKVKQFQYLDTLETKHFFSFKVASHAFYKRYLTVRRLHVFVHVHPSRVFWSIVNERIQEKEVSRDK